MNIKQQKTESITARIQNYLRTLTFKRVIILLGLLFALMLSFVLLIFLSTWLGLFGTIPTYKQLVDIKNPIASEVYSADSVLLGRFFLQERSDISFKDIPSHVFDATIVTEDARFMEHRGIDYRSLGRVAVKSILLQQEAGGGSTITQQLAKNLFPRKNYWLFSLPINKMREMIIATRLENIYDKQTILTLYLNTIPFGDNTFGLEAASQRFFSIPVKQLSIDQGSMLVGMLKATYSYNPRIHPQRALERRNVVLSQLKKYRKLDAARADSLQKLPVVLNYNKITHHSGLAPYFREAVRLEMLAWCDAHNLESETPINLYTDGLKIYTTIDSRLQRYAEEAMTAQMSKIQKVFANHWGKRSPWNAYPGMIDDVIQKSDRYKKLIQQGKSKEEALDIMSKPVAMTVFSWDGEKEVTMSPTDSIKYYLKILNTGVLAMDPTSGAVRVWVGGIDHHYFQYDHVVESTKRQVGSTIKPIVYTAALEGGARPCAFISAEKTTYTDVEDWAPENTEDNYDLKYSMPGALAYSVNTVSVRVLEKAGINQTIEIAQRMGITSKLPPVPSLALGTAEISMAELVNAYACFANHGKLVKPFYLTSILSRDREILEQFEPAPSEQAISEESADLMLHMLARAVDEGTSKSLRSQFGLTNDIAGKTGTTQLNADGWFIAVTPILVIGAWVGADDPRIRFQSTALGQGARTALPIVADFLQRTNRDHAFDSITQAQFPELSHSLKNRIDCDLYKKENTFLKSLFGKRDKERKKEFGKKEKKGFLKRIFQ